MSIPPGSLVLTQVPSLSRESPPVESALDQRYPSGSRVVLAEIPVNPNHIRVLSQGLVAAGNPVVSYDGRHVFFSGKIRQARDWQIYKVPVSGGYPQALTSMPGGAFDPALLPDGSLVFASPVPKLGVKLSEQQPPALYRQAAWASPYQLTFGGLPATDPTVLSDGRILFVSSQLSVESSLAHEAALYTINNDGTEIAAFTSQHENPSMLRRPRQLADGRVVFLAYGCDSSRVAGSAEFVQMARPFKSLETLLENTSRSVRSVEQMTSGDLLLCAGNSSESTASARAYSLFRIGPTSRRLGTPLISDPAKDIVEAVEAAARCAPMGRLSSVDPVRSTGRFLCLDANYTAERSRTNAKAPNATRVRVLAARKPGQVSVLGEMSLQADGSFLAEVPADMPLGFETLDVQGQVLNHVPPVIWVRPGENRSCVGCHEPNNRSPHNVRPLALAAPIPRLDLGGATLTLK
jgi:hypothetical protein